jgi:hypothetical protein
VLCSRSRRSVENPSRSGVETGSGWAASKPVSRRANNSLRIVIYFYHAQPEPFVG